jgi:hypothetical protein
MFYATGSSGAVKMMAVDVTLEPTFAAGRPHQLFEGAYALSIPIRGYEVAPDGRRFLMIQEKEEAPEAPITQIILVQNWFEELKQKVPMGKK